MKILDYLFFPERSALSVAMWVARLFVVLALIQFARTLYFLVWSGFHFYTADPLSNAMLGGPLFKAAQEKFGISALILIIAYLLVVLIVYFRKEVLSSNGNA